MILHLVLNSLLVFLILSLSIQLFLWVFKVKHQRICYICRSLPILKLPFDLLVFGVWGDHVFLNLNPFSCELYLQELILSFLPQPLQIEWNGIGRFFVPRYLAHQLPAAGLQFFIGSVITLSISVTIYQLLQFLRCLCHLKHILKASYPCQRAIGNTQLQKKLQTLQAVLLISSEIQVPMAANQRYIVFPSCLIDELSQEEYEAVVAHEVEHLRWKDPLIKLLYVCICTLCWWIPTSWWLRHLETNQEQASDACLYRYGLDTYPLASALLKALKQAKSVPLASAAICHLNTIKHSHMQRLQRMLDPQMLALEKFYGLNSLVGLSLCLLTFVSFWMC